LEIQPRGNPAAVSFVRREPRLNAPSTHADIQYSLDLSEWFEASPPLHAGVMEVAGSTTMKSWSIDPTICPHWFHRVR
jgi:hypothetical protein